MEIPLIKVTLECPTRISLSNDTKVLVHTRVTYCGIVSSSSSSSSSQQQQQQQQPGSPRPVTIHLTGITASLNCTQGQHVVDRWDASSSSWRELPADEMPCFFLIWDDPPLHVRIRDRDDDEFLTLHSVGDSAIVDSSVAVYQRDGGEMLLPHRDEEQLRVGDRFRIRYTATRLDWWSWGAKEDELGDVQVWLPCWEMGAVLDVPEGEEDRSSDTLREGNNGGRPKLGIREAVSAEIEIVE